MHFALFETSLHHSVWHGGGEIRQKEPECIPHPGAIYSEKSQVLQLTLVCLASESLRCVE